MSGTGVKITNLVQGQKIELYRSDNTLVGFDTVTAPPDTDAEIAITGEDLPMQGYLKIYAADGTTLLYTSSTQELVGGDIFKWSPDPADLTLNPAQSFRIYKQGAVATPKSQAIILRLARVDNDAAIANKLVSFTVNSLLTVSPASATTDASGNVTATVTSQSAHGWGILKAVWAGDSEYNAAKAFIEVPVYDEADAGDATKGFQVFVHGIEYPFTSGSYKKSTAFITQQFTIELPTVQAAIDGPLEVIIYRRGTKDFAGRIQQITKTIDNRMILKGPSNHYKLTRRLVSKSYAADPKNIILDLLRHYPVGITEGSLTAFGSSVTIPFDYEPLLTAIQRLLAPIGWKARVNVNDSLDFASALGTTKSVNFTTGTNNVILERQTDYVPIATRTFLIGDPPTVFSDKDDATQTASAGLVEDVFLDKNLTTLATVDLENQQILDSLKNPIERIKGAVIDFAYAANAYDVFDSVTVTDSNTGLTGTYQVVTIDRDMKDKGHAEIEFSNAVIRFADIFLTVSRTVKDLSV